jgi:glutamate/tyrosine decarboxylase-like PLP-dependent enzyme
MLQLKLIVSQGIDIESAYQIIHDELVLDGQPLLNLASFVQTWMPPIADKLMLENISKNLIDQDEYPATQDIHTRCEQLRSVQFPFRLTGLQVFPYCQSFGMHPRITTP